MLPLADFLSRYPDTRLATAADNARLLELFDTAPMQTSSFDVRYHRSPDFFRLLAHQAERSFVIVTETAAGALAGVATLSLRPGWMNGQPTTIGALGDLRVKLHRAAVPRWRRVFADLLTHAPAIEELADCTQWFTAVLDDNRRGRRSLEARGDDAPRLVPLAPFTMRNLVARLPLPRARHRPAHLRIRRAQPSDREALAAFFESENRGLALGFRGELDRRLARWEGLSIEAFVYAADAQGIVACVAPWSPSPVKQTVVSRVPTALRWLGAFTSRLPGPRVRIPRAGEPLRMPYLTHLTFAARLDDRARASVFRALLDRLFDEWTDADWHCVALCDFDAWRLGRVLRDFVQQTVPITVYAVLPPGGSPDALAAMRGGGPPAFEMAMV